MTVMTAFRHSEPHHTCFPVTDPIYTSSDLSDTEKKRRGNRSAVSVNQKNPALLNGDNAFHAQRKVRSTVKWILARFDFGERDCD